MQGLNEGPRYLSALKGGELARRAALAEALLADCTLCPRRCGIDRTAGSSGYCRSGFLPVVANRCVHRGEEPAISGTRGSGTIFFGRCNLRCVYCQNHQISQPDASKTPPEVSFEELAAMMLDLQGMGCHNVNLVSPSHFVPQIVRSLYLAASQGLRIPLVYNSNGYDSIEALELLDGLVDIYLPDVKYADDAAALEYSGAADYVRHCRTAIMEMKRQVGNLVVDGEGVATSGLIVRHLVLPNGLAGSAESLRFIRRELGGGTHLSVMSQYYPANRAGEWPELSRAVNAEEYGAVVDCLDALGLENGWVQEHSSAEYYRPDFGKDHPFEG